jgi:hypothetical protein
MRTKGAKDKRPRKRTVWKNPWESGNDLMANQTIKKYKRPTNWVDVLFGFLLGLLVAYLINL